MTPPWGTPAITSTCLERTPESLNCCVASDLRYTNPSKWFKYIYSLCGAQQLLKTPTAPSKAE